MIHDHVGPRRCEVCGATGRGVNAGLVYVGGHGYQLRDRCLDERACWERWDTRFLARRDAASAVSAADAA